MAEPQQDVARTIQEGLREEFGKFFSRIETIDSRVSVLELDKARRDGYEAGAGSLRLDVDKAKEKILALEARVSEIAIARQTVGSGIPWVLGVVGGFITIGAAIVAVVLYLARL